MEEKKITIERSAIIAIVAFALLSVRMLLSMIANFDFYFTQYYGTYEYLGFFFCDSLALIGYVVIALGLWKRNTKGSAIGAGALLLGDVIFMLAQLFGMHINFATLLSSVPGVLLLLTFLVKDKAKVFGIAAATVGAFSDLYYNILSLSAPTLLTSLFILVMSVAYVCAGFAAYALKDYAPPSRKKTVQTASAAGTQGGTSAQPAVECYYGLVNHILLLLFTCGIWMLIWIYRITGYLNGVKDEEYRDPTKKLLLCIFVPFYSIYWTYKSAQRIDKLAQSKGVSSEISTLCLILAIFVGIIPPILMQDKINQIVTAGTTPAPQSAPAAPQYAHAGKVTDELREYKDLLDNGVISQEEFDVKKKQLLGL